MFVHPYTYVGLTGKDKGLTFRNSQNMPTELVEFMRDRRISKLPKNEAIESCVNLILTTYEMSLERLMTRTKLPEVVWPRQVASYLMFKVFSVTQSDIARYWGQDHTTVRSGILTVENILFTEKEHRTRIQSLINKLTD
jgi:chromosomal replication initiation ATPase DnaA